MLNFIKKEVKKILRMDQNSKINRLRRYGVSIGQNFVMMEECNVDISHGWHLEIGDNVTLAPRVHLLAHDASTKAYLGYTKVKNSKIGNNVFIGAGSIIMPGVKIGNNVIIGAGSLVTHDVDNNSVHIGNPARYYCSTSDFIEKQRLMMKTNNCFEEAFTIGKGITTEQMNRMRKVVLKEGVCFVK